MIEVSHNRAHLYIGGTVGGNFHFAFNDPFVFLLHSNVDRLLAVWQHQPGRSWRLDPQSVYGVEGNTMPPDIVYSPNQFNSDVSGISTLLQPWAGGGTFVVPNSPTGSLNVSAIIPWTNDPNDGGQIVVKDSKHPTVVTASPYDYIGDHFYTTDAAERDNAVNVYGYTNEGTACYVYDTHDHLHHHQPGLTPLYRQFNPNNGDHFYTTDAAERDNAVNVYGYTNEGTACYVYVTQYPGTIPLYRQLRVA